MARRRRRRMGDYLASRVRDQLRSGVMKCSNFRRVSLDRGGYDRRGRYFGTGEKLWCAQSDEGYEACARAPSKTSACSKVRS